MKLLVFILIFTLLACDSQEEQNVDLPKGGSGKGDEISNNNEIIDEEIDVALAALGNVSKVEELPKLDGYRRFKLTFQQPVDHLASDSPTFEHQAVLYHRDIKRPTVILTTGYFLDEVESYDGFYPEVTQLIDANQLVVGYRFFAGALPEGEHQDWDKMNIEQGANDNHKIVESLRTIYSGSFIGTGWSRGGLTAIFHEFFFPEDLDVVIPMAAPISFGRGDQRYSRALANLGPESCRNKLAATQVDALERIDELVGSLAPVDDDERFRQTDLLRNKIITFDWAFWQYHGFWFCDSIPSPGAMAEDLLAMYQRGTFAPPGNFFRPLNEGDDRIIAHTFHTITELGYPKDFPEGLLQRLVASGHLTYGEKERYETPVEANRYLWFQAPWDKAPTFNAQAMIDVDTWLKNDAKDVLAVYGEFDPWTAGKISLNETLNSRVYIAQKANHAATLSELLPQDYDDFTDKLYKRLKIDPVPPNAYIHREVRFDKERLTEMLRGTSK